ncbi:hypothetical protein [Aliihoeflea sp. 40Bstr573]|uniref:hypothetical protein n=1 Tax=Aliihoeflea sp. 40Bstr573 TaxID=2696467 RepID=UPI0020948499|nr:hypothetical protein [Aliihoeflea sp. 40Bstr573]MCO6387712.1 hypothetical protein [Aliihoeflea sp. 40Bstr573]
MLKFFWRKVEIAPRLDDPLAHSAIRAMSLDEIADLPLTPQWPHAGAALHRSRLRRRMPRPGNAGLEGDSY